MLSDILRDPVWQSVGAFVALLAIIVSVLLWVFQRKNKILEYRIIHDENVIQIHHEAKKRLEIRFEGKIVNSAHFYIIQFLNAGNTAISRDDYDAPLLISFGEGSYVIDYDLTNKYPPDLDIKLEKRSDSEFSIPPALLNKEEMFTVKFLVADHNAQKFRISCRIIDGKLIKMRDVEGAQKKMVNVASLGAFIMVPVSAFLLRWFPEMPLSDKIIFSLVLMWVWVLVVAEYYKRWYRI